MMTGDGAQTTFDLSKSRESRDEGMEKAAAGRLEHLATARRIAIELAKCNGGLCNVNIVQQALASKGISLGNAAGSIFKGGMWERVGFTQATSVKSHARIISTWKLKSA